jgi:hypothetical protein
MGIIWNYRESLVMRLNNNVTRVNRKMAGRPNDRKTFDNVVEAFSDGESIASSSLVQLVMKRRKGPLPVKDMLGESLVTGGMMALHVTAWDWLDVGLKNTNRDIQPCIDAITMERLHMQSYRPTLLKDTAIGALRRLLEIQLSSHVTKVQTISNGKLRTIQKWSWWDGLTLDSSQQDPSNVTDQLKDTFLTKQQQTQERLAMETVDRESIMKLVNYVSNMGASKALDSDHLELSVDVTKPLALLVAVSVASTYSLIRGRHWSDRVNQHVFSVTCI